MSLIKWNDRFIMIQEVRGSSLNDLFICVHRDIITTETEIHICTEYRFQKQIMKTGGDTERTAISPPPRKTYHVHS